MSRRPPNPVQTLFDAALRHYTIKVICPRCRREPIFDAHALWWLFARKGWDEKLSMVGDKLYCKPCWHQRFQKIHPTVELCNDDNTDVLPMPTIQAWKDELKRRR